MIDLARIKLLLQSFNQYFVNVGPNLATNIPTVDAKPEDYLSGYYQNSLFLTPVTINEIKMTIN